MTPEEYAEKEGVKHNETVSEKGVFFACFTDSESTFYLRIDPDGEVSQRPRLIQIGSEGDYTTAVVEGEEFARMVDDDGVHDRIEDVRN